MGSPRRSATGSSTRSSPPSRSARGRGSASRSATGSSRTTAGRSISSRCPVRARGSRSAFRDRPSRPDPLEINGPPRRGNPCRRIDCVAAFLGAAALARHTDPPRDLLFGLLALQTGLIEQGALFTAFNAWNRADDRRWPRSWSIGATWIATSAPCWKHSSCSTCKRYGGAVELSLAALSARPLDPRATGRARRPEINASLARVGSAPTEEGDHDPDRTATYSVGTSSFRRSAVPRPARLTPGAAWARSSSALDEELHREVALKQIQDRHADDAAEPRPVPARGRDHRRARASGNRAGLRAGALTPTAAPTTPCGSSAATASRRRSTGFHARQALKTRRRAARSLELRKLLRRFIDVCNAIDYAHAAACCTATSSRATSWSASTARRWSSTGAWPSCWASRIRVPTDERTLLPRRRAAARRRCRARRWARRPT